MSPKRKGFVKWRISAVHVESDRSFEENSGPDTGACLMSQPAASSVAQPHRARRKKREDDATAGSIRRNQRRNTDDASDLMSSACSPCLARPVRELDQLSAGSVQRRPLSKLTESFLAEDVTRDHEKDGHHEGAFV